MKKTCLILVLFLAALNMYAQRDREFWFACPDLSENHSPDKIYLHFVTFDNPAIVTVSQPANNRTGGFSDQMVMIPANSYDKLYIGRWKSQMEIVDRQVLNYGLHITSTEDIVCFYANNSDNTEAYTLKGHNALGTDFIVPMQFDMANSTRGWGPGSNSIQIVATEDGTKVVIEPTAPVTETKLMNAKGQIEVSLDRGQAYAVRAKGLEGKDHLQNTRITSNKPIAVNYTDDTLPNGGEDLLGDQLVPITMAGRHYVAVKNDGLWENLYIFPTENYTTVTINGQTLPLMSVKDKDQYSYKMTEEAVYVEADKPIIVLQVSSGKGTTEPCGAVLPHALCTGSTEIAYQSGFSNGTTILNLVVKTAYLEGFTVIQGGVESKLFASNFKEVPNTGGTWSYYRYPVASGSGVVRIKNSLGSFHMGAYDYIGDSSSYGYFSDYRPIELRPQLSKGYYASGDEIRLVLLDSESFDNVVWTLPDGSKYYGSELVISNATEAHSGLYEVNAESKDGCTVASSSFIDVNVFDVSATERVICYGSEVTLTSDGTGPFVWKPDLNFPNEPSITVSPTENTVYTVQNYKVGKSALPGGDFQDADRIKKIHSSYINAGNSSQAVSQPGKYAIANNAQSVNPLYSELRDHTYPSLPNMGRLMIVNTRGQGNDIIWQDTISVNEDATYELTGWFVNPDPTGKAAKLKFAINGTPVGNIITPPTVSTGTSEDWQQFSSGVWTSPSNSKAVLSIITDSSNPEGAGVCIDDIEFTSLFLLTDTFKVRVLDNLDPEVGGDTVICNGQATLDAGMIDESTPYTSYAWYLLPNTEEPIGTEQTITVTEGGTYLIQVTLNDCVGSSTVEIPSAIDLDITLDPTVIACSNDPDFVVDYSIKEHEIVACSITYSEAAKQAGFVDVEDQAVQGTSIHLPLPSGIAPGLYSADLKLISNTVCADSKTIPIEIEVRLAPDNVLEQKWNNVISILNENYNGGHTFVSYKWYKNGVAIPGETKPYLYIGGATFETTDNYTVLLTNDEGEQFMTCDFVPTPKQDNSELPVTSLEQNVIITLPFDIPETAIGTATFTHVSGIVHSVQAINGENPVVRTPDRTGFYVLTVVTNEGNMNKKVFVR